MGCSCCSTESKSTRAACPGCGQPGDPVSHTTLLHQLARPWQQAIGEQQYYFCRHTECEVTYFDSDGVCFYQDALRQQERLLCYCFDIRYSDLDDASAKSCHDFVIDKTRDKQCVCEQRNPSGRCCLRDFPKQEE